MPGERLDLALQDLEDTWSSLDNEEHLPSELGYAIFDVLTAWRVSSV